MAAAVESTGTRRAVVLSERYMEWHRELNSSRAIHGGRRRHEYTNLEPGGFKRSFLKSEECGTKHHGEHENEDKQGGEEESAVDPIVCDRSEASHRIKRKKQLPQRQRSDVKKFCKETDGDQKRTDMPSKQESSPPVACDKARMRRCKQANAQYLQVSYPKRQVKPLTAAQPHQLQNCSSQPIIKRKKRQMPRTSSPIKVDKDMDERVLRSLTRTRGYETPTPAPASPAGKGTKRSKRVALRLANEEPPPPPLKLPKLQLVLTRKEIQEDWLKITGQRYTGKPKKSTIVQRGLGLCTALTCPSTIRYLSEPQ